MTRWLREECKSWQQYGDGLPHRNSNHAKCGQRNTSISSVSAQNDAQFHAHIHFTIHDHINTETSTTDMNNNN